LKKSESRWRRFSWISWKSESRCRNRKAIEEDFLGFLGNRKAVEENQKAVEEDFLKFLENWKAIEENQISSEENWILGEGKSILWTSQTLPEGIFRKEYHPPEAIASKRCFVLRKHFQTNQTALINSS
jgi:hypothetical protein